VTPAAAVTIGALGAVASYAAIQVRNRTSVDDALDVFACHGVAGIVGALLTGVFATKTVNPAGADGLLAGNPALLGIQAIAVACTIGFVAPMTAVILRAMSAVAALRVELRDELCGVDVSEHGEHAYHDTDGAPIAGVGSGARLGDGVLVPASASIEGMASNVVA